MRPIFITGTGTGIGKTLTAAIVTEALGAVYWKPVQAGFDEGTDTEWVCNHISGPRAIPESYKLALPASPHIAAREEGQTIGLGRIVADFHSIHTGMANDRDFKDRPLVIEGAGGLFVPLNDNEFIIDLIAELDATVLLVSRNYLGSINHSLLTAKACQQRGLRVAGWIFNDQYLHYEEEVARWTGLPILASIPFRDQPDKNFVAEQAARIRPVLQKAIL